MSIEAKPTEVNSVFVRMAWKARIKNNRDRPVRFSLTVEFQDANGFIIDTDVAYDLVINMQDDREFTGDKLVTRGPAEKIGKYVARVKLQ